MDLYITKAEVEDAARILALQKLAYLSEAQLYQDWNIPPLTQALPEIQSEFNGKTFLKAQILEKIVGSVRAHLGNGTCYIGRLIVHPDYQRRGIGTQLMKSVEGLYPNAERFELFTGSLSAGNIRLYQRLGYAIIRKEQLSPKVQLVFMEKRR